jgi:hypothetical protein
VAADSSEAARSFELNIGYEAGSAIAEKVLDVPPDIQIKPVDTEWFEDWPDWPSDESLISLGEYLSPMNRRGSLKFAVTDIRKARWT